MAIPDIDDAATFGTAGLVDYAGQGVVDPTTDRGASQVNTLVNDVAGLTHLGLRAWARVVPQGTGTPILAAYDAMWAAAGGTSPLNAAPTVTRAPTGIYTVTWPVTVYDEIPSGAPGYVGPHTVNFRAGWAMQSGTVVSTIYGMVTTFGGNQMTLNVFSAGSPVDPNSSHVFFDIFAV